MAYDSARDWLGPEQQPSTGVDRGLRRPDGRARRRCVPSHGQPAARGRRRARRASRGVRGAARGRFAAEWRDELPEPLAGRFRERSSIPTMPSSACRLFGGSLVSLPTRASRSASTIGSRIWTRSGRDDRRCNRRVSERPPGRARGLIIPTRGQMIATEPVPERLFPMPHYGRHGYDYWHQDEEGRILAAASATSTSSRSSRPRRRRRRGSRAHSTTSSSRFSAGGPS